MMWAVFFVVGGWNGVEVFGNNSPRFFGKAYYVRPLCGRARMTNLI
jgi:hypothetical protein